MIEYYIVSLTKTLSTTVFYSNANDQIHCLKYIMGSLILLCVYSVNLINKIKEKVSTESRRGTDAKAVLRLQLICFYCETFHILSKLIAMVMLAVCRVGSTPSACESYYFRPVL